MEILRIEMKMLEAEKRELLPNRYGILGHKYE